MKTVAKGVKMAKKVLTVFLAFKVLTGLARLLLFPRVSLYLT